MKSLTIVVPKGEGNNLSSIVGAYKIFTKANELWKQKHKKELFKIQIAGVAKITSYYEGLFTVKPHTHIDAVDKTDLIIVPSLNHNYQKAVKVNTQLALWIADQYKNGAAVASICTGAFLLASTGILDGKNCSTHWSAANDFANLYPGVKLQTDKLITDENGIYTNGGAYSFLNLMIYLIEKYYDRSTAILCSKIYQIEIDRNSQSEFAIFTGQKSHGDEMVIQAQAYIESKLDEKISIAYLSNRFAVGRRNFDRRFIKATGNTPGEYAQRVKVEWAKKAIESTRKTIQEIMYEAGYSDLKAFREVFRRITGLSPMEYKQKYHRESIPPSVRNYR